MAVRLFGPRAWLALPNALPAFVAIAAFVAFVAIATWPKVALAQPSSAAYPTRPVKVVVPFLAGGVTDVGARLVLDQMARSLGGSIVIENKAGAGTRIGTVAAKGAAPDGYTLLMTNSNFTMVPAVEQAPGYDAKADFAPVGNAADYGVQVVVNPVLPIRTVRELVEYARQHPDQLTYGSAGVGSGTQLLGENFKSLTGTRIRHVPFRSTVQALQEVAAGRLDFTFDGAAKSFADSGKVRVIAVTDPVRDPRFPDVPTMREAGYPDMTMVSFLGLFAPAGTPEPVMARLNQSLNEALASPALRERLAEMGMRVRGGAPADLGTRVSEEVAAYRRIVRTANLVFNN